MNFLTSAVKMKGLASRQVGTHLIIFCYSLRQKLTESQASLLQQVEDHEVEHSMLSSTNCAN